MKIYLILGLISIILFGACAITGDSQKATERKAKKAFEQRDYQASLAYSIALLQADSQRVDALYTGGESARYLRDYDVAILYLERIPDNAKSGDFADADFGLASAKMEMGEYAEAARLYRAFLENGGINYNLIAKAKEDLEYCDWAIEHLKKGNRTLVRRLGENVNTAYSDFAPLRFADKLYFSSSFTNDTITAPVIRLFSAIQDGPAKLYAVNTDDKNLNSCHIALTSDARRIFYTICENSGNQNGPCAIYTREKQYEGNWGPPKKLPRQINLDNFTATQPTVGYDKILRKDMLYFASNRPGGNGNMDIWGSILEKDGTYGQPFPLPFNTPQDDVTPFFHQPSQTLFFSSNGLGNAVDFDVFKTSKTGDAWAAPENVGPPINSAYDDLYYTFHSGSGKAYFASNRPGNRCPDPDDACTSNDIYEAQISAELNVLAYNALDSSQLSGVTVELTDLGRNKIDTAAVNPNGNSFSIPLELEKNYRIAATLDGYLPDEANISTEGTSCFTTLTQPLYLRPGVVLVVRTFNAVDRTPLYGVAVELADRQAGHTVVYQNTASSQQCSFPLDFGKNYFVTGSKPSYSSDNASTSTIGLNRPDTIFQDLYLSPFMNLPLVLYFDNGKPGFGSWLDTATPLTYEQTYLGYLNRKPLFVKGFSEGLTGAEKEAAEAEINAFFENEVEANFAKLRTFSETLIPYLQAGNIIEILVSGYASPLASADYNRRLTERRISSLENHFRQYKNGIFLPWIKAGGLTIKKDPKGEEFDIENVSDDVNNRRLSEFSPAASRLRRVTITRIKFQQGSSSITK
ncbi:MAG: hypothetical protein H6577_08360 [Lewinellaceae bacterium]|nr:hypothetical protein [Saprospiraceae bacterium]MCB9338128.1 hypothetical protein [Lewinellaceae bacterium]